MRVNLDGRVLTPAELSLEDWRKFMSEFMRSNANASAAWDIMGCVRGPDAPSEREDMDSVEHSVAYAGRRKRKRETVEVLREAMFFGVVGGAARSHKGDHVTVPPRASQDHFDRHVVRAAQALKITVKEKTGLAAYSDKGNKEYYEDN